jgi:DNA polymerase III epsilon subunit-like protein
VKAAIFDVETTGFDPKVDRIIEVGAMVVDGESWAPEGGAQGLVWEPGYPALTPEVEEVTGISQALLEREGRPLSEVVNDIGHFVDDEVAFVIAHNSPFDEGFFREEMMRTGLSLNPKMAWLLSTPWLCSIQDISHPPRFKCRKLSHLALDYGLSVDPKQLHRAMGDVELLRRLLAVSGATAQGMYEYSQIPTVVVAADVSYDNREQASSRGYKWQKLYIGGKEKEFTKQWVKAVKKNMLENEETSVPFKVLIAKEKI